MPSSTDRTLGVLVDWNDVRGFGFIRPLTGGPRMFAHISAFDTANGRPQNGDVFDYAVAPGPDGRPRAANVRPVTDPAVRPRTGRRARYPAFAAVASFAVLLSLAIALWGASPWVAVVYLGMSLLTFALYARDKRAAIEGHWRIPEHTMQAAALFGGWPGGVAAQQFLRHKNRKVSFQVVFWLAVIANVAVFVLLTARPDLATQFLALFR